MNYWRIAQIILLIGFWGITSPVWFPILVFLIAISAPFGIYKFIREKADNHARIKNVALN